MRGELVHLTQGVIRLGAEPPFRPGADAHAWAATVATVAAWPAAEPTTPVVERRLWRQRARGPVDEAILAALHDPIGLVSIAERQSELQELVRPLRAVRATRSLSPASARALEAVDYSHIVELSALNSLIPEGNSALPVLFADLVAGASALRGPVAVSLAVAPLTGPSDEDDDDPELGDDPRAEGFRRVRFRLRLCASRPIPASLRARAEALCLSRRPHTATWRIATSEEDRAELNGALREVRVDGDDEPKVRPHVAALTLALPAPVQEGSRRTVHGRPVAGPLPAEGAALGRVARPEGRHALWRLDWERRRLHTFIAGASGCGKSTTLLRMVLDDLETERMVVVLDPHGDLAEQVSAAATPGRVSLVDPRRDRTDALDLLDPNPGRATSHLMSAVNEIWPADFSGPVWQRGVSLGLRVLAARDNGGARTTLAELERFFVDWVWRDGVIAQIGDRVLAREASHESEAWRRQPTNDASIVNWMAGKFTSLTRGPGAPVFARQPGRPLETELRDGHALLITLPIGLLGADGVRLAMRMFLTRLTTAIAAQASRAEHRRRPISVVIDEAHLVAGPALSGLAAQARKFNASVTLATQSPSQLDGELGAVLTNVQTLLLGRLPNLEARAMVDRLGEQTAGALATLPRHHLVVALEDHDAHAQPVVLTPIPPPVVVPPADDGERTELIQRLAAALAARRACLGKDAGKARQNERQSPVKSRMGQAGT